MKCLFVAIISFLYLADLSAQNNVEDSIHHQLTWRTYKIHFPSGYDGTTSIPLIVALHGGGHNADTMEFISNLSLKADLENFIVVYPNARKFLTTTWNAGNCCGAAANLGVDDVGFIVKLVDSLKSYYAIDTNRIYLTGASNGGMLAYRIACEHPKVFAAVAPVAATMLTSNPCTPGKEVPILHIHSSLDTHVPLNGGVGTGASGVYMPPNDSIINVWRQNNLCIGPLDTIYNQSGTVGVEWTGCSDCSELFVYITLDGGHSWPGGNSTVNGDQPSTQLIATDLIWSFFQSHSLNCYPLSLEELKNETTISIYPNPTNKFITIKSKLMNSTTVNNELIIENPGEINKIEVYSVAGQLLQRSNPISTEVTINFSTYQKGLYLIKVFTKKGNITTSRVVKK